MNYIIVLLWVQFVFFIKYMLTNENNVFIITSYPIENGGDNVTKLNLNRLKAERVAKGYTQEDMAIAMNHKRNWYTKRENGYCDIGVNDFLKIIEKLGYTGNDVHIFLK